MGLFVKRSQLLRRGYRDVDLRQAVECGSIIRVRSGWYTVATAPPDAVQGFRIGGRLTGLSALRTYGIWTPDTRKVHVTVPADARGLRRPHDMRARLEPADSRGYRITWTDSAVARHRPHVWRTSITDTLVHILNEHDRVTSIVCLDAALHSREAGGEGIVVGELDDIFARAPRSAQAWRNEVDGRSEAGGETEFRLRALAAGIPFVPQPFVEGVGRLDGQIGPSTFVEIDGATWHDNPEAFEVDCRRDLKVAAHRGRVLRFTYQVFRRQWNLCDQAMRNALEDDYALARSTEFPAFPWRLSTKRELRA